MHPKSMTTSSPRSIAALIGRAWGFAPFGPDAMIGSKLLPLAPRGDLDLEVEREVAFGRSVRRGAEQAPSASLAMPHTGRIRAPRLVLHAAQPLDEPVEPLVGPLIKKMSANALAPFKYYVEYGRPFEGKSSQCPSRRQPANVTIC